MQHQQGLLIARLIGTNRIDGRRVTAAQMAAASAASFFDHFK
jgi:hypothetical protein